MHNDLHRITDIVEIIQRLTHAHQHDVCEHAAIGGIMADIIIFIIVRNRRHIALWPFAKRITGQHNLTDNFARRQIAHQPHGTRMTKTAV